MRRKDREVSDFEDIMDIINHCDVCRVVVNDGEFPYIIPMNFGTEVVDNQLYLYFHSAKEGKKIDLFKKNNKVTFEMDCEHNIIRQTKKACVCFQVRESVNSPPGQPAVDSSAHPVCVFAIPFSHREQAFKILPRYFFRVRTIPATAPAKITGATRQNSHSNACRAVPATAVSGSL